MKIRILLIGMLAAVAAALGGGATAFAASDWDNIFIQGNFPVTVTSTLTPYPSTTYNNTVEIVNAINNGGYPSISDEIEDDFTNGYYVIVNRGYQLYIITSNNSIDYIYTTAGYFFLHTTGTAHRAILGYNYNNNSYFAYANTWTSSVDTNLNDNHVTPNQILANNFNVNYPLGYNGYDFSNNFIIQSTDLTYQPHISLIGSGSNFIAKYSHTTTDPTSNIPEPYGLRWLITNKSVIDETSPIGTEILCESDGYIDITDTFSMANCPGLSLSSGNDYAIVAGVYIGSAFLDDYEFEGDTYNITYRMASIDLNISIGSYDINSSTCQNNTIVGEIGYGTNCSADSSTTDYFTSCINAEFPFLHVDNCGSLFNGMISLFTFDTVNLGNDWESSNGCHTLTVLDDWLLLADNYVVCPQFPEDIRNSITPFVTLMIGLITVKLITDLHAGNRGIS